jgi:Beta-propeller repeat
MQLKIYLPVLGLAACAGLAAAETNPIQILTKAPLRFEPSAPASGHAAKFIARGARFHFEFSADQAILRSGKKDVRLSFDGANRAARMEGTQLLGSTTNLYLGNDPSKWRHAVPNYGRVEVEELYPGIDLAYYGNGGELEYDLTVNPAADPRSIRFRLDGSGLIQKHPVAYQTGADGSRHLVTSSYQKNRDGSYGFRLGAYDRSRALVIDPVLVVAQYFAGSYENVAYGIGHDGNGKVYIGGTTQSTDLPLVGTPYQSTEGGDQDLFFAIVNPKLSGSSQVLYVTYFGGTGDETFGAMSVSATGDVYMTGSTESANFPLVNAYQSAEGGSSGAADAFVAKFNSSQNLVYSTYYGGSETDTGTAISVASNGWIWIAGNTQSTDLPIGGSGFQASLIGTQNMFIAGFDTTNSGTGTLLYAIYIGGTHWDEAYGVAVAPDGTVWLAGGTYSPDIWIQGSATQGNPYQGLYGGDGDAYVAHINPALKGLNALLYSSFLGGSATDAATSLVLDPSGRIILSGYTLSSNFPVTSSAFQTKYGGNTDAFITILDTAKGQLVYSTYFGGSEPDAAMDLKEDSTGALYVSGYTESAGLPATSGALQANYDDSVDAFGLKLDPTKAGAAGIDYFSYLGSDGTQVAYGVDFDTSGNMYLAGYSSSNLLSRVGGPARPTLTGNWDAFVIGFPLGSSTPAAVTSTAREHHRHIAAPVSPHR